MSNKPSLNVNNGTQVLIQDKYLINTATSITNNSDFIYTKTTNNQYNKLTGGDYDLLTENGNINLTSNINNINITALTGDLTLTSGNSVFTISNTGGSSIIDTNIDIGNSSNTETINLYSSDNINLSSDAITSVSTDNTTIKSTDGEIILDTSPETGNSAFKIDNSGNIIINNETTRDGYLMELNVTNSSITNIYKNGISINNLSNVNSNVSPEYRAMYLNTSNVESINALGIYSDADLSNKYRSYTGYQYGNQIITIDGLTFTSDDIGKTIYFEQDQRNTIIQNLGSIILPPDGTFNTSNNSLIVGGVYTGSNDKTYLVSIDSNNVVSDNTFKWSKNGGESWINTFIPCSYAVNQRYPLSDGVYISFSNPNGFNLNDHWTILAKQTAIVNSNILINGSITNDESNGTVITSISNNTPITITSNLGAPVFSNITGNIALSRLQNFKTLNDTVVGYVGTTTNTDLVFQTASEPRLTLTSDGGFALGDEEINSRFQINSNFNKSMLVNNNILSSNITSGNSEGNIISNNSNLATNILNYQLNPSASALNSGGYVTVYESQNNNGDYDIYGDLFTANGERIESTSFKINTTVSSNQSHTHVSKSGLQNSSSYLVVWNSNINGTYQIRGQLFSSNNVKSGNEISIAAQGYTPRVTGLSNGNFMICYCVLNNSTNKFDIRFVILSSDCSIVIKSETVLASSSTLNLIYPYCTSLSSSDLNYPNGFVISYMKQLFNSDTRYQTKFKIVAFDGMTISNEFSVTETGFNDPDDIPTNSDLSLSDSLMSLTNLPSNESGFLIAYQTNYSASVSYSNIIELGTRNIFSISGNGNGNLSSASINETTGIQTLTLTDVNGSFLENELIYLVGPNGNLVEKIESIEVSGSTATIILSKDPKSIAVAKYSSDGSLIWRNTSINTTSLELDSELLNLVNITPDYYLREDNNKYAYRSYPSISSDNSKIFITWNNGSKPSIYYQVLNLTDGSKYETEYRIARQYTGLRQVNPVSTPLLTRQNVNLGYAIIYNISSLDLSKTAIYQELIGINSYLAKINNDYATFLLDNDGRLLLGTDTSNSTVHFKTKERLKGSTNTALTNFNNDNNYINPDICKLTMENNSNGIIANAPIHIINFETNDNNELGRISVNYSTSYQGTVNENLVTYFKFDESNGSATALDSGIYNLQSNTDSNEIENKIQNAQLINFNINKCWVSGKINNGLEFDGIDSYLKIPLNNSLSTSIKSLDNITSNDFSISFWFKINGDLVVSGTEMDILSYGSGIVGDTSNGGGFFQLYFLDINSNGNMYPCFKWAPGSDTDSNEVTSSTKVNDNNWHLLALTISRGSTTSNAKMYLDNEIISNETLAGLIGGSDTIDVDVYIGAGISGSSNYFRGILDEFRVYRNTLSTIELNKLWKYGNSICGQIKLQTFGEFTNFNSERQGLIIDDTNKLLSSQFKSQKFNIITGLILVTPNSKSITGSNTIFKSEINAGDYLYIDNTDTNIETEGDYANTFNQRLYLVTNVTSDIALTINRIVPDVTANPRYFSGITVKPSIITYYNIDDTLVSYMDYNGDYVIGKGGRSEYEYTKMDIRGSGTSADDKNGLMLTNTDTSNLNINGGRANRLLTQSYSTDGSNTVLQGHLKFYHSGTGSDNKSAFSIYLNDGTTTTNLDNLKSVLTMHDNGTINMGQTEQKDNIMGDLHIRAQENSNVSIALFSEESATGVFTEKCEIKCFGSDTVNEIYNESRGLGKLMFSNDNTYEDPQLVNGRFDLFLNNEPSSNSSRGLISRLTVTSEGNMGLHTKDPNNILSVNPQFIDSSDYIYSANIESYDSSTRILTFDSSSTMFGNNDTSNLLRYGSLLINNNGVQRQYIIDPETDYSTLNNNQLKLSSLNNNLTTNDSNIIGQDFDIYYSGLDINKYGLISIGNNSFTDANTDYHLLVHGDTKINGDLIFGNTITDSNSNVGLRVNSSGLLQIRDNTSNGFVNLIGGPLVSNLETVSLAQTLDWSNSTVLIDTGSIIINLPEPSSKYNGYIFTLKNIASSGPVIIATIGSATIDGSANYTLTNQYDTVTVQTNGINWFIISKIN